MRPYHSLSLSRVGGGGYGQFVLGQKCEIDDLLWGIQARETEVPGDDLGSDVKYCSSTGKMVYSYPSRVPYTPENSMIGRFSGNVHVIFLKSTHQWSTSQAEFPLMSTTVPSQGFQL